MNSFKSRYIVAVVEFEEEIDTYDADMDQLTLSFNSQTTVPDWMTLNGNMISGIPPINGDFPLLLDLQHIH